MMTDRPLTREEKTRWLFGKAAKVLLSAIKEDGLDKDEIIATLELWAKTCQIQQLKK